MYLAGPEDCKNHIHGRIVLFKDEKSLTYGRVQKAGSCLKISWIVESNSSMKMILRMSFFFTLRYEKSHNTRVLESQSGIFSIFLD